ncbi:MAG: PAS domain S-box protein [Actinomycetota bacterium]|jgi:PAS domain S-box-containing protein|nr:PAS domain S-box protein [Actinomycetota bacterium]
MRPRDLGIGKLFERIRDAAIVAHAKTQRIVLWNQAATNIFGYSTSEALELRVEALVPERLKDRHRAGITRYAETGHGTYIDSPGPLELPALRKGGEEIYVELSLSPIGLVSEADDSERYVLAIVRDITARKRAEEEVRRLTGDLENRVAQRTEQLEERERRHRESEERFRGTFEQAAVGMAHVGTDGRWLRVNRRLCDIVGYEKAEMLGLTFQDITHPDDLEAHLEYGRQLLAGEIGTYSMEKRYYKKDGSIVWINLTVSLVHPPSDEPRYFICVIEDITERKRIEEAQRFLAEAGTTLSSSLDYRTTLARVARLAVPFLADWCVVDVLEKDGSLDRLAVAHQDPEKVALVQELQKSYPPDPDAPRGVGQVLRTGRPELGPEITESLLEEAARDAEHREILGELGLKSYMIVPLVARGRTLGAISLISAESGRRYRQAELGLAEELARRAALAVDNARLYRDRAQVARTLQEGLLPSRLPEVPGVEVGLCYLSAGEVDVGGDFYDLFETRMVGQNSTSEPSSSWVVVIGDVSGKGAEAAAVLALARYTIRALAMRESHPSDVLTGLNEAMLRQRREHDDHKFCTATYARLETNEGNTKGGAQVTVCCGGHPPPFVLKADGSIHKVGQPGRAIGVFDDMNLTEQEASLSPGDALVLYTDGVVEAQSPDGLFFGEERLVTLLRSSVALDAATIAGRVESAVLDFQGQAPRDDIAVLVLRASG